MRVCLPVRPSHPESGTRRSDAATWLQHCAGQRGRGRGGWENDDACTTQTGHASHEGPGAPRHGAVVQRAPRCITALTPRGRTCCLDPLPPLFLLGVQHPQGRAAQAGARIHGSGLKTSPCGTAPRPSGPLGAAERRTAPRGNAFTASHADPAKGLGGRGATAGPLRVRSPAGACRGRRCGGSRRAGAGRRCGWRRRPRPGDRRRHGHRRRGCPRRGPLPRPVPAR